MPFLSPRRRPAAAIDLTALQAVFFDLDGTLIDVDMSRFVPGYLQRLARRLAAPADVRRVVGALHAAVAGMLAGSAASCTLEHYLQQQLAAVGVAGEDYRAALAAFCEEDLEELRPLVRPHPLAGALVAACHERGWLLVLATNPIFPRPVIDARLAWGGLAGLPFHLVTSYENSRSCKPHREYFTDLLCALGLSSSACLMVGNDTQHDMAAGQYGLPTCLLTPWRIDRPGGSFPAGWEGTHQALLAIFRKEASFPAGN